MAALGQKARRTGRYGGLRDEKSRKRERLTGGLPRYRTELILDREEE
jgi:hypothetical protein